MFSHVTLVSHVRFVLKGYSNSNIYSDNHYSNFQANVIGPLLQNAASAGNIRVLGNSG